MVEQAITQEELHLPLLNFIADHGGEIDRQEDDLLDALAERLGLTAEERQRTTESGRNQWRSTVEWSRYKLIERHSALDEDSKDGVWRLSDRGWSIVRNPPSHLRRQFEAWREDRTKNRPEGAPEPPERPSGYFEYRLDQMQENAQPQVRERLRLRRNRALADALKQEYDYCCQLCHSDEPDCPVIPMKNGRNYVEVHHIMGLAEIVAAEGEGQLEESEYQNLTSYHNVIVVCPYHHILLHHRDPPLEFDSENFRFVADDKVIPLVHRHPPHLEGYA